MTREKITLSAALILAAIAATIASAADSVPAQRAWSDGLYATARLIGDDGRCQYPASCVIVGQSDDTAIAVACAHQARTETSWTIWPIGHSAYPATLIYRSNFDQSPTWSADIAVFRFQPAGPVHVAQLADCSPGAGTPVEIRGYPLGSAQQQGKPRTVRSVRGSCLTLHGPAQQGDSGGAVLDRTTGNLVGILSSTGQTESIATDVRAVREVLGRYCSGEYG